MQGRAENINRFVGRDEMRLLSKSYRRQLSNQIVPRAGEGGEVCLTNNIY